VQKFGVTQNSKASNAGIYMLDTNQS